jgi:hypothetical protein
MGAVTLTPNEEFYQRRERDYNIYLASLDIWEIHAYCRETFGSESLELAAHDMFVCGAWSVNDIGLKILEALGEL